MTTSNKISLRLVTFISFLISFHVLMAYGLPAGVFLLITIILGVLYYRAGSMAAVSTTLSLVLITVLYAAALKLSGLEDSIYYRPDEKLSTFDYEHKHRAYVRNSSMTMAMPHGDLRAMTSVDIAEPRTVTYKIDANGFRNSEDYHGQKYLLVGDSFIIGTGNTQADILAAQLKRNYAVSAYTLAHPGDIVDYATYVQAFRKKYGNDFKVLLFLFEGNDFQDVDTKHRSGFVLFWKRYYNLLSDTNVSRVTKSLYKRALRRSEISASKYVSIMELAGQSVGFLNRYTNESRRMEIPSVNGFEVSIEAMAPNLERIYFIPTKYRVYQKHVDPREKLPNAQWLYLSGLCEKHHLACTNLSGPLIQAADEWLKQGRLIWWRDDTHWNKYGIAVAAREVAKSLSPRAQR